MLLGTLGASFLDNLLAGQETIWADKGTIRAGKGTVTAVQDS